MAKNKGLQAAGFQLPFILLAEDDDNDAFGMELAFHKAGLGERVRRVCDGDEAIDYLSGKSKYSDRDEFPFPSLLLLDLKMTHKDGFAVLDWARSHPRWRNIVIVVLTNSDDEDDIKRAYRMGANSYLVKPSDFLSFTDMLQSLKHYWRLNQIPQMAENSKRHSSHSMGQAVRG